MPAHMYMYKNVQISWVCVSSDVSEWISTDMICWWMYDSSIYKGECVTEKEKRPAFRPPRGAPVRHKRFRGTVGWVKSFSIGLAYHVT